MGRWEPPTGPTQGPSCGAGPAMGGARLVPLVPLLLLLPTGSIGLQCLSCGSPDGRCPDATNVTVTCPPDSDVCAEALAAVTWSHGRFALGGRGCGRGQPGAIARALELLGLVVFERRRHCGGGACNHHLPLGQQGALPLPANSSGRTPNGLECFGCPEEGPCPPKTIVQCYDPLRGCFHGNVTLRMGNVTMWREVRGCVRDGNCAREWRGDDSASLSGSCCSGNLCNGHLANATLFDPDLPRLELLPHGHAPTAAPKMADNATTGSKMAAAGAGGAGEVDGAAGDADEATGRPGVDAGGRRAAAGKMAAGGGGKMAAGDGDKMAEGDSGKMAAGDKMADGDGGKMAAGDGGKMAAGDKMADSDSGKMATEGGAKLGGGDKMAAGDKTAGGRQGRKDGIKGPSGRGHPLEGPGWLLPFLLLPLLR